MGVIVALIVRGALYGGLTASAERFHTLLADFLRSIRFKLSRFDRDILEAVVVFHCIVCMLAIKNTLYVSCYVRGKQSLKTKFENNV